MSRVRVLQGAIYKQGGKTSPSLEHKVINMNDSLEKTKQGIITYFRGVKTEWGKITWPEKNQVVVETFFVIAIVAIFTIFIYIVDVLFNAILGKF